jgi:hypothetical protein
MTPYLGTEEVKMLNSIMRTLISTNIADLINMRTKQDRIPQQTCDTTLSDTVRTQYDPRRDLGSILGSRITLTHGEEDKILVYLIRRQPAIELYHSLAEKLT